MDPQAQASFIPKKSLDTSVSHGGGGGFSLAVLIALLIFIASLVSGGAVVAYTKYLNTAIDQKSKALKAAEGAYAPETIQELKRMDTRLNESKNVLSKHTAVSGVFAFLSNQTLEKVAFKSFSYTANSDGTAEIKMDGDGESYATVALQSDQFNGNKLLSGVVFSGIAQGVGGRVNFTVVATLDASVLSYAASLEEATVVPVETAQPEEEVASTTQQ